MSTKDTLAERLTPDERRVLQLIGGHLNRILLGKFEAVPTVDRLDEFGILLNLVARASRELQRSREQEQRHRGELEERVAELTAAHAQQSAVLAQRLAELERSHEQQARLLATVRALSSPILAIHRDMLLVPLIGELDRARVEHIVATLLARISSSGARVVILDVTGVPAIDREAAELVLKGARSVALLGARAILSGMSPAVAAAAVALAIELGSLHPCGRLAEALALARELLGER